MRRISDNCDERRPQDGFTLLELLIVTTITPIIIGALAAGLLAVFSLQSSTSSRLADTGDSQIVSASFQPDVQSALELTIDPSSGKLECGTSNGTQLIGLEWNLDQSTGNYQTLVSYVESPNGSSTSVNLVRNLCTGTGTSTVNQTPVSTTILSYDLPNNQAAPTVTCSSSVTASQCSQDTSGYIPTADILNVSFGITEPKSKYSYTLDAAPEVTPIVTSPGSPINNTSTTSCGFASPGSGTYAATLCFVDFTPLTGAAMTAATTGCLEMSASLPGNNTLYFCINISGPAVIPHVLPTYSAAFLGNSNNNVPFYTNVPGEPALYQNVQGATDTVTLTGITVVTSQGVAATGWEMASVDAESTDNNESITWTSNEPLYVLPNGQSVDTPSDPVGNACDAGAGLTGGSTPTSPSLTVECNGNGTTGNLKTGTAMVEAAAPTTMTAKMVGTGLEAVTFGLLLS